jgi:hypothetical protein
VEARDAVGALARHMVLKVPDKADFRALAAQGAAELVAELPTAHQHTFVVFITRLSRTPKASPGAQGCKLRRRVQGLSFKPSTPSPLVGSPQERGKKAAGREGFGRVPRRQ